MCERSDRKFDNSTSLHFEDNIFSNDSFSYLLHASLSRISICLEASFENILEMASRVKVQLLYLMSLKVIKITGYLP